MLNDENGKNGSTRSDLILLERTLAALYGHECKRFAKELMARFGSLGGILSATTGELEAAGLTHRAAALIALSSPVLQQALYRANCAVDCERGLAVVACIEYIERPYPFKLCVYTDECGRLIHTEVLDGRNDVSVAISGGARSDARHFGIVEYSPYASDFTETELDGLESLTRTFALLDILFIDWLKFDGLNFRSLVDSASDPVFDLPHSSTFRRVCSAESLDKILRDLRDKL